jgi:transcription antitermination factor NusA-like protein
MKRILGFILGIALTFCASAVEPFQVEIVKEVPLLKSEIYDQTVVWIAENFKSSKAVIEMKDKDLGVIIGNASMDVNISLTKWLPAVYSPFTFKMKVEMKDEKLRMTFNNVKMITNGLEKPIEDTNRESNEKLMTQEFQKITDSLSAFLSQPKKTNW